ncbi:MAG: J domain-containing protein [Rhodothermales bacterium]|nr:J domain-containing protein [Rhodothermales bacterium]
MSALTESALLFYAGLAAFAAVVGALALVGSKLARRRSAAREAEGGRPQNWGGRDRERMRTKYFEKERRARERRIRERERQRQAHAYAEAAAGGPAGDGAPPPGPVNLERLHRETLGLEGELTPEAIKRAFKDRIREYHPDRVVGLGVKLQRLAEEETKRINEAYRYLRQRHEP